MIMIQWTIKLVLSTLYNLVSDVNMILLYASTSPVCLYNVGAKCKQYQMILFVSFDWLNTQQTVEQLIKDHSLDVLALTETWYSASDDGPLVYSGQFRTSTVLHYSSLLIMWM